MATTDKPISPAGLTTGSAADSNGLARAQNVGAIPLGDVRLTANINADLHLKLKIRAAQEHTTMGELIEGWIRSW